MLTVATAQSHQNRSLNYLLDGLVIACEASANLVDLVYLRWELSRLCERALWAAHPRPF